MASQTFWWPRMYKWVAHYTKTCETCQRVKPSGHASAPLQSLPVPADCWRSMSLFFVFGIPVDDMGNTSILVFVCRLSKMVHLAPVRDKVTGEKVAQLFLNSVFRCHGLPETIVSDRDLRFTGAFWDTLFQLLGTKFTMSTADHPQTDGQTERGYQYSFYHGGGATRNYRCSLYRRTRRLANLYISRMVAVVRKNHKPDCVPECVNDDSIVVQGATKKQIMDRLYRTRRNHFGREIFGRIEIEPLCGVKYSPGLTFFQFHFTYYKDEVLHRVIGWSHQLLMDRLKQRHCSIFVDATFRCVPTQFYQLVVVMMYDPISIYIFQFGTC
ncbi:Pol protein [Phytophthora palmivora]|uniref:Pol protein n=1 Tax=Phytophthora palmivora TaxID=4796 RepID=A0A2P4WXB0_9STRA|nr:Pol protein [Phytophthora palmivora]